MNCLHPIQIQNPYWSSRPWTKRYLLVPCGHCVNCYHMRRLSWVVRMEKELSVSSSCFFVTLTYADDCLPIASDGRPTLFKRDHQLFMKRLRKAYPDCNIRFFMCGEYGDNFDRPHYHYVLFNLPLSLYETALPFGDYLESPELEKIWQKGIVQLGSINPGGMSYVAKYCQWREDGEFSHFSEDQVKPFSLMSRRPAIGEDYLSNGWRNHYMYREGKAVPTPRYYRKKMGLEINLDDMETVFDSHDYHQLQNMWLNEKMYFYGQKEKKQRFASYLRGEDRDHTSER